MQKNYYNDIIFFMANKEFLKYKEFIELFFNNSNKLNIKDYIDEKKLQKINNYVKEAIFVWNDVMLEINKIEINTKTPIKFKEKIKLYALDAIIIAESLKISKKERKYDINFIINEIDAEIDTARKLAKLENKPLYIIKNENENINEAVKNLKFKFSEFISENKEFKIYREYGY